VLFVTQLSTAREPLDVAPTEPRRLESRESFGGEQDVDVVVARR
jgi:hypothetical protein